MKSIISMLLLMLMFSVTTQAQNTGKKGKASKQTAVAKDNPSKLPAKKPERPQTPAANHPTTSVVPPPPTTIDNANPPVNNATPSVVNANPPANNATPSGGNANPPEGSPTASVTNPVQSGNHQNTPTHHILPVISTTDQIAKPILDKIGQDLAHKLADADSIEAYLLYENQKDTTAAGFQGYKVEERKVLTAAQVVAYKKIVFAKETYFLDNVHKRCYFTPRLGFVIRKKKTVVANILIATDCDMLRIFDTQKTMVFREECDPAHAAIVNLGKSIFTNKNITPNNQ
jgi:hypothetical protein